MGSCWSTGSWKRALVRWTGRTTRRFPTSIQHKTGSASASPNGKGTTFASRVSWARTYLMQAGLLEATRRAHFRITDRGRAVLARGPERIDNRLLLEFPEFQDFKRRRKPNGSNEPEHDGATSFDNVNTPTIGRATPEELIHSAYQEITDELRSPLLNRITSASPAFFEKVVLDLLIAMGYGGSRTDA